MERVGERKRRSDKKRDVKPVINMELKDNIYRLSYVSTTPVKDVCNMLCIYALNDKKTIAALNPYFRRDMVIKGTLYVGHSDNLIIEKRLYGKRERVTIKFKGDVYEAICTLSYALDCSPSRVVAVLLELAMQNVGFIYKYMGDNPNGSLNGYRLDEWNKLLKFVEKR